MDKKRTRDESMIKRKRLDARTFRDWHVAQGKKYKSPTIREIAPERKDKMQHGCSERREASCLGQEDCSSESRQSHSKQQRMDFEVKSQPSSGETILERLGSSVPEGCEQAYLSVDVKLHEITLPEMIVEGGNVSTKEVRLVNHVKSLLHVESGSDGANKDVMEDEPNCSVHKSDELSDSKPSCPSFIEYWVPVGFSRLQLEKYCETLITNSMFLCTNSKRGILDGLHDVLTTISKCCDHPYLLDQSLEKFVNEGRQTDGYLSTGIEASGKLLLLDKFLHEAREKQCRVLIVFQSNHSTSQLIHLRHILDDFIRQRFGEESYVHIYREFDHSKRRAALDLFNVIENGKFVILIEKSSSQSSIKLSSVDFVILFNSNWNPITDIKFLQKMSIQSKFDHVKVLRLYSSNSVEEKVVNLAKEGNVLDSNIHNFSLNVSHKLLLWGASYLFDKLDDFHSQFSSTPDLNSLSEQNLVLDVLHELSALLPCQENKNSFSLISRVPEAVEGYFGNISLHGENDASSRDDDIPHYAIWISLLEGKNPPWKLLPESSKRMRRRVEAFDSLLNYSECESKGLLTMHKKGLHSRSGRASHLKPRLSKSPSPASRGSVGKVGGTPKSGGNRVELSTCGFHVSIGNGEEICYRRMQKLLIKQKREIREFYRTKREKRTELVEEHRLELDLISQRYRETTVNQDELNKLDHFFKEKVEEHNHQMDIKRKKLDDLQRASRIKEKQLKDKSITWFMMKNSEEPISSCAHAPSLDSELGFNTTDLVKNSIQPSPVVSNSGLQSEIQDSKGTEKATIDGPSQNGDIGLPPHHLLTETEILSVESDGENDAILVPENGVSCTASLCEEQSQDMQHASNREIEGDGSTNMEVSEDGLWESDGENDAIVMASGECKTSNEPFNDLSDLCIFNENKPSSGPNLPNREVQNGECEEASVGASNREIERRGTNVETISIVARHQSRDDVADLPSSRVARSSCALEERQTCSTSGNSLPIEQSNLAPLLNSEVQNGDHNEETLTEACNGEAEGGGVANLDNTSTVAIPQRTENVTELPSSILTRSVSVQAQTCTISRNLSPLEQPMRCANLPCNKIMQTTGRLALPNCQALGIPTLCLPGQLQAQSGNLGLCDLSTMRPTAITSPPLQSVVGRDQPHASNGGTTILRPSPANSYFQEISSLRSNIPPSSGFDPLHNELVRMQKEEEGVIKIHEEKMMHLKSACAKEIEEIHEKYDLLLREAENALLLKKQDLASCYAKVCANKFLADTLQYHFQRRAPSTMSEEEALLAAVVELSIPRHHTPDQRVSSTTEPTAPSVQVVHQLSELMSVDQIRLQNGSSSHAIGNPLVGYQARVPTPYIHFTSLPLPNMSTPFYGAQNQQILVRPQGPLPGLYQMGRDCAPGFRVQLDGSWENPVFL